MSEETGKEVKPKKSIKFSATLLIEPSSQKKGYRKTEVPALPKIFKYEEEEETDGIRLPKYEDEPQARLTRASTIRWRDDSTDLSRPSYLPRLTTMFSDNIMKRKSAVIVRPIEKFLPTYQLESKNPFNPRIVEDILKSLIETRMENISKFDYAAMESNARSLSEDILFQIKALEFDRFRILVSVTITEKFYQGFGQCAAIVWDIEKDSMASYVFDRSNFFVTVNVFGVYFE